MCTNAMRIGIFCFLFSVFCSFGIADDIVDRVLYIKGNQNEIEKIQSEASDIVKEFAKSANLVTVSVKKFTDNYINVSVTISPEISTLSEKIGFIARNYVALRAEGHSKAYCYTAIKESIDGRAVNGISKVNGITGYLEIPSSWISSETKTLIAFPKMRFGEETRIVVVIDNEMGWVYFLYNDPRRENPVHSVMRFDTLETRSGVKEYMYVIFEELRKLKKTPETGEKIGASWWFEFQSEVEKKMKVKWRTPVELNPESLFD